ncbi:Ribonuclease H-like domain containing protein [Elaphomyces granulatus]
MLEYGKHKAFIISVITRWGSNFGMIHSLLRTKTALQRYALDSRANFPVKPNQPDGDLIRLILSHDFWRDVEIVHQVLQPVHEVQKKSESSKSHLGHVIARWNSIRTKWLTMRESGQYPQVEAIFAGDETSIWTRRHKKQQNDLTWLAWVLDPGNDDRSTVDASRMSDILRFLKEHTPTESHTKVIEDFFAFRDCEGKFGRWRDFWKEYKDKPTLFWKYHRSEALPCFSAMNFVQDKYRSRLSAEKTDMLTFIYMNSKVLRRKPSEPAPTWYNLTEDQEEEFENLAYEYVCGFDDEEVS